MTLYREAEYKHFTARTQAIAFYHPSLLPEQQSLGLCLLQNKILTTNVDLPRRQREEAKKALAPYH